MYVLGISLNFSYYFLFPQGQIVAQGTFLELAESELDITNFINVEAEDEKKEKPEKKEELSRRMSTASQAVFSSLFICSTSFSDSFYF